jgi:hypothetical protein
MNNLLQDTINQMRNSHNTQYGRLRQEKKRLQEQVRNITYKLDAILTMFHSNGFNLHKFLPQQDQQQQPQAPKAKQKNNNPDQAARSYAQAAKPGATFATAHKAPAPPTKKQQTTPPQEPHTLTRNQRTIVIKINNKTKIPKDLVQIRSLLNDALRKANAPKNAIIAMVEYTMAQNIKLMTREDCNRSELE